jgi:5-methylcytosine-specific restriction endonuclease McrA
MNIISRAEAKAAALKRYFPGTSCKHGHVAERLTVNGSCLECCRPKQLKNYHANREENLRKQKIRRDSNPNHAAEQLARRHRRNPALAAKMAVRSQDKVARELARALGQKQYASPRPCGQGHLGNRFVGDGHCVECNLINCRLRNGYLGRFALRDPGAASRKEARRKARAELRSFREAEKAAKRATSQAKREIGERRHAALAIGAKTYIGSPCPRGHDGLRYAKHGTCVECAAIVAASPEKKAYDAIYQRLNIDRILARTREYSRRHAAKKMDQAREWARRNPEKRKAISMANKAKRRAIEKDGDPTSVIFAWVQKAPKVCYWCGTKCKTKYHVDHYKPLSKGGKHEVSNLVIACPKCNLHKSAKDPYAFAASMGRLF